MEVIGQKNFQYQVLIFLFLLEIIGEKNFQYQVLIFLFFMEVIGEKILQYQVFNNSSSYTQLILDYSSPSNRHIIAILFIYIIILPKFGNCGEIRSFF